MAPSSRKVRMTFTPSTTRDSGFVVFQSVLYCASRPKLPLERTTSARPPVSSSRVAAAWAMSVGSRRATAETLGPLRTRDARAAGGGRVGGGGGVGDERGLARGDRRDARAHAHARGARGGGREQQPQVLVPGLVGGVHRVEAGVGGPRGRPGRRL